MKYIAGFTLSILVLGFAFLSKQNSVIELSENKKSVASLQTQKTFSRQQLKPTMKPAWYRYFNPHQYVQEISEQDKPTILVEPSLQKSFIKLTLVNFGEESLAIPTQNGSLIMIQEAQDPSGKWKPIEYWDYRWRGESHFSPLHLNKGQAVEVQAPHYQGDFMTKIRFKLKIGDKANNMLYSDSFESKIDFQQFQINPEITTHKNAVISYLN